jgi:hypothetical protein
MSITEQLSAPFPPEAIHWRSQQVFERDGRYSALALAYIDARDVMDRLDEVCGPCGWQDSYVETPKGRVICSLSILCGDGEWISKSDGAGDTAVEGEKGGISDAFKRAGVKWGIGRYLYALGNVYAPCEANKRGDKLYFKKWLPEADRVFAQALAKVSATPEPKPEPKPVATITEAQLTELQLLFTHLAVPVADFLKVAKIKSLSDLPADWFERAKKWINEQAKAKRETTAEALDDEIPY